MYRNVGHTYKQDLFRRAHVCVVPSLDTPQATEGFGIVALEAMSWGCAVVASRAGGIPDATGSCARLFAPGDARACADALYQVLTDTTLYRTMVSCGFRRVRRNYLWEEDA
jgi:glycosyltransferase involved in cell wall biosynthesis